MEQAQVNVINESALEMAVDAMASEADEPMTEQPAPLTPEALKADRLNLAAKIRRQGKANQIAATIVEEMAHAGDDYVLATEDVLNRFKQAHLDDPEELMHGFFAAMVELNVLQPILPTVVEDDETSEAGEDIPAEVEDGHS